MTWRWPWTRRRKLSKAERQVAELIRASYDAARTTDENSRHWRNADALSAIAAGSRSVRATIRNRARYEVANNSIARGIVLTLANDVIGLGPRLQLQTKDPNVNRAVEAQFHAWATEINLSGKLRTMRMAKASDGEAFAVLTTNESLASPVKLDLRLVEADRVTTPLTGTLGVAEEQAVDGITFDQWGNPKTYSILRRHPGAARAVPSAYGDAASVPAKNVLHWFRADRPEQRRGLPDLMPALPLFALLRRFTLATLTAAETAANFAVIMKTNSQAGLEAANISPYTVMELERNIAMFAPEGWEPSQLRAEHPAATFQPFRRAIINEIARCVNMPYNVAACDSSEYNYASGRLDHQLYFKSIAVERDLAEALVLRPIFSSWIDEAIRVRDTDLFPQITRAVWPATWMWPGRELMDPLKEAKGAEILLKIGLMSEAQFYGQQGRDWEQEQEQRGREAAGRINNKLPALKGAAETTEVWQVGDIVDDGGTA